ncbi:glycosyltransferase [Scytonema sp. UIC 10036]|uniref:glycosyltransferase n=1 Tax=Scytonema sp. UIC 10036 TaxID=2304196 RepID=UPI0012DA223B|nr:glycosyltransferase [Scytonema sp. UIC 10036]MUG98978.1 glycosyltransferase [Scytonema sp. UIC 10036]
MKKITFLIRSLERSGGGGAEKQLATLAKALSQKGFEVTILRFYPDTHSEVEFSGTSIKLLSLEKQNRWDMVGFFWRLLKQIKSIQPDVLHSYLPDSNIVTIFLKPFFPTTKMVWGIRHSNWGTGKKSSWWINSILYVEQKLARFADLIIANSYAGQKYHLSKGFPAEKTIVIPNGIDVHYFKHDPEAGKIIRQEWGVSTNQILIGLIGRLHPMKDHSTFLKAAALLFQEHQDVRFVCIGGGVQQDYAIQLYELTNQLGIAEQVIWAGARLDMPEVYNALDIFVSASAYGEGFSNAIGEAMACGKTCVVTDVGDSASIVGNQGIVVPPGDPQALKTAVMQLIAKLNTENYAQTKIRQRIVENFSVPQLLVKTEDAILGLSYER